MNITKTAGLALAGCLIAVSLSAESGVKEEMKYLGYSDDITKYATEHLDKTHKMPPDQTVPPSGAVDPLAYEDEADLVKEQLAELGRTRSMTPATPVRSGDVKDRLKSYWGDLDLAGASKLQVVGDETKTQITTRIKENLEKAGYSVKDVQLSDVPSRQGNPRLYARVRAIRPLKSRNNKYKELRENLKEIGSLCTEAATIDGHMYLDKLTSFVTENPKERYFYVDNLLTP